MLFNSIDFLLFFPVVVAIYFIIPKKIKYIWLLIASYYFYMSWNPKYALLIAYSTLITYASGILIEKADKNNNISAKKMWVAGSFAGNLLILGLFKYANFFLDNLSSIAAHFGIGMIDRRFDFLLPVGISFYTFQALSYTVDVYRGNIKPEKNILKYALFVSFFPQLVAGPIERSKNLLTQIQNIDKIKVWDFDRIRDGFLMIVWGLFQKLVIAERVSLLVNTVTNNYQGYGFLEISLAVFLFAFQIYCDFGGYSNIAIGAAKVMGFVLMDNFKQPYLAVNINDFWKRWHISLTSWFTDYLYIPLGGNRKGTLRKYINILIVFGVSGLWHGASWNFVVWGLLHAFYRIIGEIRQKAAKKLNLPQKKQMTCSVKMRKAAITFVLVDFAWIFFVSNNLGHALAMIRQMFVTVRTTSIYHLGLDHGNWFALLLGIAILMVVDILHERNISVLSFVNKQEFWFRWILYLGLVWTVIMFGVYGVAYDTSTFIYFQF